MEDEHKHTPEYKVSYVLIAIDTHPSMFIKTENSDATPFRNILNACYHVADSLILKANTKSYKQFAVVFADNNPDQSTLFSFKSNLLESMKLLEAKRNAPETDHLRTSSFDFAEFIRTCKKLFIEINSITSTMLYNAKLLYFTNDDDPVAGDSAKRFTAFNECQTLKDLNIDFQPISTNARFDYSKFYNELFAQSELTEQICVDEAGLIDKISSAISHKFPTQRLNFYPFLRDTKRFIKTIKVDYVKRMKFFNNAHVAADDGTVLKKRFKNAPINDGYQLDSETDNYNFDALESASLIDTSIPVGISLLYINKRQTERAFAITKNSLLQFQDDGEFEQLFNSYWQYCASNSGVLVCACRYRSNDKVRYVELIPKCIKQTRMFMIKSIPFGNDIDVPAPVSDCDIEMGKAERHVIEKAIDALHIDKFSFGVLPNATYLKKKTYVKAKLLDQPVPEIEDVGPDENAVDECLKEVEDELRALFGDIMEDRKRKREVAEKASSKKLK